MIENLHEIMIDETGRNNNRTEIKENSVKGR
jgi:hypothetical protein